MFPLLSFHKSDIVTQNARLFERGHYETMFPANPLNYVAKQKHFAQKTL